MIRRLPPFVIAALLLSACAGGASPQGDSPGPGATGQEREQRSEEASPTPSGPATITLAFAGDVHFERQVAPLLEDSDEEWADRLPELAAADFSMVNLETAITTRGRPANKAYTFRAPPAALDKLAAAGVDAVSLANNHAADYGRVGVEDTLAAIDASPIPVVGFGENESVAYAPLSVDVQGVDVGVIASMEVHEETYANWSAGPDSPGVAQNIDKARFTKAAQDAVSSHDLVVAFMHWGTEGSTCPNERQVESARILEEAGVDIIVGTHAHRPQGSGWKGRAFVGYGTGNFIWYNTSAESRPSGVLTVTVDANAARARGQAEGDARTTTSSLVRSYEWTPKLIAYNGVPSAPGEAANRLDRRATEATRCADLSQEPS